MMVSDIDLLFIAYLHQSGKLKQDLAELLHISPQTMTKWWQAGVTTWRLQDVITTAHFLGIPIDTLREVITYRKDR